MAASSAFQLLDSVLGSEAPRLASASDLAAFEAVPYAQRVKPQSTYEALRIGASADPSAPALHFLQGGDPDAPVHTISHADFFRRVTQTANLLHSLGVGPGDVVSLLAPLVPQSFYTLFGAQAAGIVNPVNPLLSAAQIGHILRAAGTKVLVALGPVAGSDIWDKVQAIRGELPDLRAVLVLQGNDDPAHGVLDFDLAMARQSGDRLISGRSILAGDVASYFHTGGTTGTPKLVRHSHGNEVYQAWGVGVMLPVKGRSLLFGLPLFHVGGALTQALGPLAAGATLVAVSAAGWRDAAAVRNVWRIVERYRPELFGGVPTVLTAALSVPTGDADVSSIRCVSGGGSAIPVAVGRAYEKMLDCPVIEVYGMTETSSIHTLSYPQRPIRLGSVGHALPYSRVRVVKLDGDGHVAGECAVGEIGVVAMAGPGVFSGYLDASHQKGAFVEPGWVNSGDLGRLDEEGYLWITGRAKDLIIRGGHNIDPQAIEEVLFQHPAVALSAVVGQPDAYAGELPIAFVQLKPGVQADVHELLEFVRERTPERAAVPVELILVSPMPLTAVGKIFKPALRWQAADRVVTRMLQELVPPGATLTVHTGAHESHGSLTRVGVEGAASSDERQAVIERMQERLAPLAMVCEVHWR